MTTSGLALIASLNIVRLNTRVSFMPLCCFSEVYLILDPTCNKYSDLISYLSFIRKMVTFLA